MERAKQRKTSSIELIEKKKDRREKCKYQEQIGNWEGDRQLPSALLCVAVSHIPVPFIM